MFTALAPLVQAAGKLTVTLFAGPDGRIKVCVAPSAEKGKEVVLATPLTLSATPEELDQGFAGAIVTYQASRSSLADQIDATATVLKEAAKSQSSKAVKALAKAEQPAPALQASATATGDDLEEEGDDNGAGSKISAPAAAPAPAPAAASGTDLFSLF